MCDPLILIIWDNPRRPVSCGNPPKEALQLATMVNITNTAHEKPFHKNCEKIVRKARSIFKCLICRNYVICKIMKPHNEMEIRRTGLSACLL